MVVSAVFDVILRIWQSKGYCQLLERGLKDVYYAIENRKSWSVYYSFLQEPVKLDRRLAVLKIFMIFRVYCF